MSLKLDPIYETPLNTWAKRDDHKDLAVRLAATYQLPTDGGIVNELDSMYPRSTGQRTSLAVHTRSEAPSNSTTASEIIPSLTRGNSDVSSVGSAETDFASALDGMRTLESVNGVLQVPVTTRPLADLICPFQILDCEESFNDNGQWKTHIFSHFRGKPCPVTATCFLCERVFDQTTEDHPARAWNEMLNHLATEHFRGMGERLATVRTDFVLMRWMYTRHIITPAQFKRTQMLPLPIVFPESAGDIVNMPEAPMAPPPTPSVSDVGAGRNEIYTIQASPRRERRTRRDRGS